MAIMMQIMRDAWRAVMQALSHQCQQLMLLATSLRADAAHGTALMLAAEPAQHMRWDHSPAGHFESLHLMP